MTVLSLFSLEVIEKIFENKKVSFKAKALYLNCLTYWFGKMNFEERNLGEFYLYTSEIKNYDKWSSNFDELVLSGLLEFKSNKIIFYAAWSNFLDAEMIIYFSKDKEPSFEKFYQQMKSSEEMINLITYKTRLPKDVILQKMELFYFEQKGLDTSYKDEQEFKRHFYNWVNHQANSEIIPIKQDANSIKILGLK
jgi:hypothetical protein